MDYQCPICQTYAAKTFLRREKVPANQNVLFEENIQAINMPRGTLNIAACSHCGFVFNVGFDHLLLSYNENYDNTQSYSPVFEKYLDDQVDYLINQKGVKNCRIIEVGCGKGLFLKKLVQKGQNTGIGFDPSYLGPLKTLDGKLCFKRSFYDESSSDLVTDVIICRHVIEHIANPLNMLEIIRKGLVNSPHAQVFLETPDIEWILKNQVVWDFFYEHCSYFSLPSIKHAFEKSGFWVRDIKNIFEGQYFWVESQPIAEPSVSPLEDTSHLMQLVQNFDAANTKLILRWKEKLVSLRSQGNIAVWGAGAKGVTFANLFDPKQNIISCIIDINPQKQNKFLPGTGHEIVDYQAIIQKNIKHVILLNPIYRQEIETLLFKSGIGNIEIYEFSVGADNENND